MHHSDCTSVPPTRNGVGPSRVSLPSGSWDTVLEFLVQRFPAQPAAEWRARMQQGLVLDGHGTALEPTQRYRPHSRLYYYRDCASEARIPFEIDILHQDAHLVVVDKPHFLPVTPSGRYLQETVLVRLRRMLGCDSLVPIHRIDRDTAGLVMFSLQRASRDIYHALFRSRQIEKIYEAVAPWRADLALPLTRQSRIGAGTHFLQRREQSGEPNASTHVELLQSMGPLALYRLRPTTGQRHQLRVHMAALGLPLVGDGIYPRLLAQDAALSDPPLQLLARALRFTDPLTGRPRAFESRRTLALAQAGAPEPAPTHSPTDGLAAACITRAHAPAR